MYGRWFNHLRDPETGVGVHAESIIMFRDGVSEGQYQQVMDIEIMAIRRACREKCGISPLITYIIVTVSNKLLPCSIAFLMEFILT